MDKNSILRENYNELDLRNNLVELQSSRFKKGFFIEQLRLVHVHSLTIPLAHYSHEWYDCLLLSLWFCCDVCP